MTMTAIHNSFRILRITNQGVKDLDKTVKHFKQLEKLILTANNIQKVDSRLIRLYELNLTIISSGRHCQCHGTIVAIVDVVVESEISEISEVSSYHRHFPFPRTLSSSFPPLLLLLPPLLNEKWTRPQQTTLSSA